eukprot:1078709_1
MNYNKHNQNASSPNNQRRQKTIPLSAANNMKPPPAYAQNQMNGTNMNHMNQYNPSPRNIPHRKSPRSKNKKNKKGKLPDNPATHRGRSHTTGHNVLNTQQMANANSPISAISPISPNGPTQPYMTMPPPPQNQPPRSTGNTPHNRKVSPMGNRNHNPHMNQWGPPQHPLQQNHNPNAIYNPQQHMYNNNPSLTNNQFPNHNATGTMIQHMNQGTHPDVPNLYDDRSSGSNNVIPNSTSHPTSLHQGATLYQSRSECVWSIHLFEQTEVASKFQCETCRDVPRKGFAFTSDQQTGVYCEYCIDLKVRQGMDIQHKTRLPIMVQNMIDKLKVKCPRYAQCKHKGTVHGLVEHLKVCNQIKGKKKSGAQAKQCPLEYMGCVEFTGGYLKEHYDEYQQEHFDFVIAFFENKLHKFETQLTMKLTETQTEIAQLKAENVELKNEIVTLNTAKEHLSSELVDIRQSLSEMKQQQSVVIHAPVQIEENNPYKIVVNEAAKEAHSKQSQHTQNSDREHGNWNSFLNAHRRLSTKTGATIPDTQQTENAAAGAGAMVHGNYAGQLLSNPQSFNTQQSSSYASSMRSETASEDDDAKQMELPLSDQKMVVIDIGSQLSKVGTAGSNKPAVIFQSMVAKHKLNGSRAIGSLTGNNKLTNYACSYPVDRGVIKNYDEWESIVHCIFYDKLQINPKEYNALMVEPILSPKKQSLKILQICFDKFDLNALFLAQDALCALYASGGNTGLSVSSGHGLTTVVPIYEGYVIPHAAQKLNFAGGDINSFLKEKLNLHGLFRSQLSENKFADSLKQKLAYVATDYQLEKQHTMFERIVYRLPDGSEIEVGQERFECAESLFDGRSILNKRTSNTKKTVADLVNQALTHASDDIRQVLFENIVCSGGNTMLKGFDERLKKEVDANAPDNSGWKTRVFGLVDRKLSCWIGGSIMASLSHMDQLWITRKQYQECGPNIINRTSY